MKSLHIKNWKKFQHFKDRRPPWIKLYRDILDDPDWHALDPVAAKALVMLWLIGSEGEGYLPDIRKISFRLRLTDAEATAVISQLSHWIEEVDIASISDRYHDDTPETETEKKKSKREKINPGMIRDFEEWYAAYPRHVGRAKAIEAYCKARTKTDHATLMSALVRANREYAGRDPEYIPHPTTWLNQERWLDEDVKTKPKRDKAIDDMYATLD